jgi:hypothetical protein
MIFHQKIKIEIFQIKFVGNFIIQNIVNTGENH